MIDLTAKIWEFHPQEEKAIQWLNERGYDVVLIKQLLSKLVFEVSKNGTTLKFEFPKSVTNVGGYMELFERSFELATKIKGVV